MKIAKKIIVELIILFVSISWVSIEASVSVGRWDTDMIKEVEIWKNFHVREWTGNKKYWEEKKVAMRKIIDDYPDSQWADDALLILACGTADYENNEKEAAKILKVIINNYKDSSTIIVPLWARGHGCQIDSTWVEWSKKLMYKDPNGLIKGASFGDELKISVKEKEVLNYFEHMKQYPVYTKVIASFFLSGFVENKQDAVKNKLAILDESKAYLLEYAKKDRLNFESGFLNEGITRPEYWIYISVITDLNEMGESEKALLIADEFGVIMEEGVHWGMTDLLGDTYSRLGCPYKAEKFYQLALDLLDKYQEHSLIKTKNPQISSKAEMIRVKLDRIGK